MRSIPPSTLLVEAGIDIVDILLIKLFLNKPQPFAEAYKME